MKKSLLTVFLILLLVQSISAQTDSSLNEVIDFSITVKDLYTANTERKAEILNSGLFIVIEGSVSSIDIREGETPELVVELVSGEWLEDGNIGVFRCRIHLTGEEWLAMIPENPKKPSESDILLHRHLLVIGTLREYATIGENSIPVVEGSKIRVIP